MVNKRISTRFFSKQQENKISQVIGGKTTPNSGARPYQKGDVMKSADFSDPENYNAQESWLLEAKTSMTPKQSFSIKKQCVEGIKEEAFQAGKMNYALVFSFGPKQENYYVLTEDKFKQLFGDV